MLDLFGDNCLSLIEMPGNLSNSFIICQHSSFSFSLLFQIAAVPEHLPLPVSFKLIFLVLKSHVDPQLILNWIQGCFDTIWQKSFICCVPINNLPYQKSPCYIELVCLHANVIYCLRRYCIIHSISSALL